jgi:hypothetical protein
MDSSQDFSGASAAPDAKGMMVIPHGVGIIPHGVGIIPHGVGIIPNGIGIIPHGIGIVGNKLLPAAVNKPVIQNQVGRK